MTRARHREQGFTLVEMMLTLGVMSIVLAGIIMFVAAQARMNRGTMDRSDIQRGGRAALSILEEKIGQAGLGLSRLLAIKTAELEECTSDLIFPRLEVAAVDYARQWTVQTASGSAVTLQSATPSPLADLAIPADRWLFLYGSAGASGHGFVQNGAAREVGTDTITIGSTDFSAAQSSFGAAGTLGGSSGRAPVMYLADVSGFGVDCSNAAHPFLYWENNSSDRTPLANNVQDFSVVFHRDTPVDGVGDGVGDDTADNVLTIDPDAATAEHDDVVAVEIHLVIQSEQVDAQLGERRTEEFYRLIRTPNIHTTSTSYWFIYNDGI